MSASARATAATTESPTLEEAAMIATGLGALGQLQSLEPTVVAALCQPGRLADPVDGWVDRIFQSDRSF